MAKQKVGSPRRIYGASNSLPPPVSNVPKAKVGETVQNFVDLDDIKDLDVQEGGTGTFTVTPIRK